MDCPACHEHIAMSLLAEVLYDDEDEICCPHCEAHLAITLEIMSR